VAPHLTMRIYSWNMLYRNKELDRAFAFVAEADFDIFCLQEVPPAFLERLKHLPCHIAFCTDQLRIFSTSTTQNFSVILSNHPITQTREIPFAEYWDLLPWRAHLFVWLMRPFHFSKIHGRHGLLADIRVGRETIRILNLHLALAQPARRRAELESALKHLQGPTILCGDFNTLESPHITPLNWCMGSPFLDTLLFWRERNAMEHLFAEHGLRNPLRGKITHPFSRSQLDHILISPHFSLQNASVISDSYGSDHSPISVQTT
jgi:endonuclease/exonuclease/phosphatase family metal-dependent hydrolase